MRNKMTIKVIEKYYCKLYQKTVTEDICDVCSAFNSKFGECENSLPYYGIEREKTSNLNRCSICKVNYLKYPEDKMCVECQRIFNLF